MDILAFASFAVLVIAWIVAPTGSAKSSAVVTSERAPRAKAA
jgi:hypothetical protein